MIKEGSTLTVNIQVATDLAEHLDAAEPPEPTDDTKLLMRRMEEMETKMQSLIQGSADKGSNNYDWIDTGDIQVLGQVDPALQVSEVLNRDIEVSHTRQKAMPSNYQVHVHGLTGDWA